MPKNSDNILSENSDNVKKTKKELHLLSKF